MSTWRLSFLTIPLSVLVLFETCCFAREFTVSPDVVYGHKAGMALTYDVVRPKDQNGAAILFIVSGGWVSRWSPIDAFVKVESKTPNLYETAIDKGYTLFIVRHGSSPYFKVPDAVADVRRGVRHIRQNAESYGIDANRLGVFGFSAGGHLTLMLGTAGDDGIPEAKDPLDRVSNRVKAIVPIVAPTKLVELLPLKDRFVALDFPEDQVETYSPLSQASGDDAAALLIHGEKDDLVPVSHSERMAKELERVGVNHELLVIKDAGHGFNAVQLAQAQEALFNWFDKHLLEK